MTVLLKCFRVYSFDAKRIYDTNFNSFPPCDAIGEMVVILFRPQCVTYYGNHEMSIVDDDIHGMLTIPAKYFF